jgi:hypothetical protein
MRLLAFFWWRKVCSGRELQGLGGGIPRRRKSCGAWPINVPIAGRVCAMESRSSLLWA